MGSGAAVFDTPSQADLLADPSALVKRRMREAREARKATPYEPTWLSNLAFAAGKHYHTFDRFSRTMALPPQLEQDAKDGKLYTADVITERRQRLLGELSTDDDRPELLLVDEGDTTDDYQQQLNRAVGFGWDHEWDGDNVLLDLRRKVLDLGTAAVRVTWDPQFGKVKTQAPFQDGKPVLDPSQARTYVADTAAQGGQADIRDIREGRIRWEVLTPFNLLVPPGIEHERDFPWEAVMRPVLLSDVQAMYPAAADLTEDTDIASIIGLDTRTGTGDNGGSGGVNTTTARLRDHVWLFTYYERPTAQNPKGRVLVFAGNQMRQLTPTAEPLPICAPDGSYRSGIEYFHWWRVTGRFWSRSVVEGMKDIQRRINKRTNQIDKTIDRDQPIVFVDKNSKASKRKGLPMEVIELDPGERMPTLSQGHGPGAWMYQDKEDAISDLDRASTLGQVALGENPANVNTYAQLAQLHEQEAGKRTVILKEHETAKNRLVEDSVHLIRTFWGPDKQILLDSDDDRVQARVFNATKVPDFFLVKVAKGAAKPRTQGAELQKITDIWQAAIASGVVQQNPAAWVKWYDRSLDAGQAQDLPEQPNDAQTDKAELENHLLNQGQQITPAYYDSPQVHIPVHRDAQTEADMAGDPQTVALIEQHIQQHIEIAQQVAEQQAQQQAQAQQTQMSTELGQQQQAQQALAQQPGQQPGQQQQSPPQAS